MTIDDILFNTTLSLGSQLVGHATQQHDEVVSGVHGLGDHGGHVCRLARLDVPDYKSAMTESLLARVCKQRDYF
ncbi:hypothetical protein D9M68_784140 [compost metagenome]